MGTALIGKHPGCEGCSSYPRDRLGGLTLTPMADAGARPAWLRMWMLPESSLWRGCRNAFGVHPHLVLNKDTPEPRPVHPPELRRIMAIPQAGGLHHRYERRAA